ncbi:MAG: hypothetical protein ACRC10_05545 [Thermoguttaceae bacterium]
MGKYTKATAGHRLDISAEAYNAFLDSVTAQNAFGSEAKTEKQQFAITGINKSGIDLPAYGIVGIDGLLFEPDGETFPPNFFSRPTLKLVKPNQETHEKRFGVTQQSIGSDKAGPVLLLGLTPVRVQRDGTDDFSEAGFNDSVESLSSNNSGIPILWHEKTNRSGNWCWAFALLGGGGGGGGEYCWGKVVVGGRDEYIRVQVAMVDKTANTLKFPRPYKYIDVRHDPLFPISGVAPLGAVVRCVQIDSVWYFDKINY